MRILPLMISMISRSNSIPAAPVSLNPAEMTMPPGMPSSHAFAQDSWYRAGRSCDHHNIWNLGKFTYARVSAHSKNVASLVVDWEDSTAKWTAKQIPQYVAATLPARSDAPTRATLFGLKLGREDGSPPLERQVRGSM